MKSGPRPESYWRVVMRQFCRNHIALFGLVLLAGLFALALSADFIANDKPLVAKYQGRLHFPILNDYGAWLGISQGPRAFESTSFTELAAATSAEGGWAVFPPIPYSPNTTNLDQVLRHPSSLHFFGTDDVGRDIASRIVHGSRISLSVGLVAVSIYVLIGVFIGGVAGFYGGLIDVVASRLIETMLTIPTLFLIITIAAFLPQSTLNVMVVIGLTNWPTVARLARGEFLKTKPMEYLLAARAMGASDSRMILLHALPNTLAPVFVSATFGVASAILIESTLSFFGFGVPQSTPSWGAILASARPLLPSGWWLAAFPGLAIFLTVTSYNLVGEGLRDASDPRLKT